jgi:hypothetical protein
MMFDIKKPCVDCPFRKDGHMLRSLGKGRMEEIVTNVVKEDGFFSCHKTVDYSDDTPTLKEQNRFCAGALIAVEKADATYRNRNTRIANMMGIYDPKNLRDKESVIDPKDYL